VSVPDVEVERLVLRLPGDDAQAARGLARLVAEGLAAWRPRSRLAGSAERVGVSVSAAAGERDDALAERIVAALVAELELVS
jgi:hypothetical protein